MIRNCSFCGNNKPVIEFKAGYICRDCISLIKCTNEPAQERRIGAGSLVMDGKTKGLYKEMEETSRHLTESGLYE